jgi:hypothetical protein
LTRTAEQKLDGTQCFTFIYLGTGTHTAYRDPNPTISDECESGSRVNSNPNPGIRCVTKLFLIINISVASYFLNWAFFWIRILELIESGITVSNAAEQYGGAVPVQLLNGEHGQFNKIL